MKFAATLAMAVFLTSGCRNPAADKPRATVEAPKSGPTMESGGEDRTYAFDGEGSKIGFVGAKVTGKHDGGFGKFSGTVTVPDGSVEGARVDVEIDMSSIWTDTDKLTGHLLSPDFFDVANHPVAGFASTGISKAGDGTYTVTGNLKLHGVEKSISFPAAIELGDGSASARGEFSIDRRDFGIVYPGMPDDLIKDDVLIKLGIEAKAE